MGGYQNFEKAHDSVLPAIMILPEIQAPKVRNIPAHGATLGILKLWVASPGFQPGDYNANKSIPEARGWNNVLIKIE